MRGDQPNWLQCKCGGHLDAADPEGLVEQWAIHRGVRYTEPFVIAPAW